MDNEDGSQVAQATFLEAKPKTLIEIEFEAALAALERGHLLRERVALASAQGPVVTIDGDRYISFASNDYLGLASAPEIIAATRAALEIWGVGAGASHALLGHSAPHSELERELADFVAMDQAVLFSSGYTANLGMVSALARRGDAILADKLNHASLHDAMLLSHATHQRYPHGDLDTLERLLRGSRAKRKWVLTDAVFSMDGDVADVPALLALCERYDAYLILDDAHGFGVLGDGGRGTLSHFGIASPRIVYMATLSKAAGAFGAFVAGRSTIVRYLAQRARTGIYTTAPPPAWAVAARASVDLMKQKDRQARLRENIRRFCVRYQPVRWRLLPSLTAIQPIVIGDIAETVAASARLRAQGFLVPAVRPPTVPKGTARLRVSLSAAHCDNQIDGLAYALAALEHA